MTLLRSHLQSPPRNLGHPPDTTRAGDVMPNTLSARGPSPNQVLAGTKTWPRVGLLECRRHIFFRPASMVDLHHDSVGIHSDIHSCASVFCHCASVPPRLVVVSQPLYLSVCVLKYSQPACSFCFRPQPTPRRSLSMTHDPCSRWPQHNPCPPTRFVTASINLAGEVLHLAVPGANRGLLFSGLVLAAVQPRQVHVPYGVDPSK